MRILGIDPGSRITGYGVIDIIDNKVVHVDSGGIHVPAKKPLEERLLFIHEEIKKVFDRFAPTEAAVEDLFFAKNAKSALMLGHARGVILLALAKENIPFSAYSPKDVKLGITGYGNASKEQVQFMIKNLLKLKEAPFEDASDALAIAICHSNRSKMQNRLIK